MPGMTRKQWEEARQTAFRAQDAQTKLAYGVRAIALRRLELVKRKHTNININQSDVEFVKKAVNVPDVNIFLELVDML